MKRYLVLALSLSVAAACKTRSVPSTALTNPSPTELAQPAPDSFKVVFETSKGSFTVQAYRAWSPLGVDRFHYLTKNNYWDGVRFFRVLPNFVVQFGIHGNPLISAAWNDKNIADEQVKQSNQAGYISYAKGGPNTRTTQLFINKRDNGRLDSLGFSPIARVIDGMHVVEQIYPGYGDGPTGPNQGMIRTQGNAYLDRAFPMLDSIIRARIVK